MSRIRTLPQSFGYAFEGLKTATKKEPNFRIHLTLGITAVTLAWIVGFSVFEWLLLLFTICFVLILELFNTALEAIVNLVSPDVKPHAKIAKDVSAAAVLLAACMSVAVGFVLFLPKILVILN